MIELDILIEEIELSNMSRVSKKYIYENLLDIRQKLTEQLTLCGVSQQRELLIAFLEMNNWFSLEDRKNAEGVVDCYLKAINCG